MRTTAPGTMRRLGCALVESDGADELQAVGLDLDRLSALQRKAHELRRRFQHHCRKHVRAVDRLDQGVLDALVARRRVGRQVDEGFGSAVAVLAVVVQHRLAQRDVGDFLVVAADRRNDVQAARIGFVPEHLEDQLTRQFGGVLGMQPHAAVSPASACAWRGFSSCASAVSNVGRSM